MSTTDRFVVHPISGNFADSIKVAISTLLPDKYQSLDDFEGPDPRDVDAPPAVASTSANNVILTCRVLEKNSNPASLVGVWQISKTQMLVEMFTVEQLTVRCDDGAMWVKSSRINSKKAVVASSLEEHNGVGVAAGDEMIVDTLNNPNKSVESVSNNDTVDLTCDDGDASAPGEDGTKFPVTVHHVGVANKDPVVVHSIIPINRLSAELLASVTLSELYSSAYEDVSI